MSIYHMDSMEPTPPMKPDGSCFSRSHRSQYRQPHRNAMIGSRTLHTAFVCCFLVKSRWIWDLRKRQAGRGENVWEKTCGYGRWLPVWLG